MPAPWRLLALASLALVPATARAGTPECSDVRIDDDADCVTLEGSACSEQCGGQALTQTCSTQQYRHCQGDCNAPPDPACTEACASSCDERCAEGVEIVCHDNCFPECIDACTVECDTAVDTIQCRAACEATCDGECDHQCAMLPEDADCISHCIECCGGSCSALANMGCQIDCQTATFETCEQAQVSGCQSACEGEGVLFCDGQLVAAGPELAACADALHGRDIAVDGVDPTIGEVHAFDPRGCACRSAPEGHRGRGTALALLAILGLLRRRRPRRAA